MVQAALKLVLEPIFEADFQPCSYGFRPRRRAQDAIAEIHYLATPSRNYEWVFEADITACFDEIDHTALMGRVRDRIGDKHVLGWVKAFLKAGVLTQDDRHRETLTGTPQGGILSPLLANIALSVLDEHFTAKWVGYGPEWKRVKYRRRGGAVMRLVRYADLCRARHKSALAYPFNRSSRCAGWSSCRSALSWVHGWTPGMVPHRFGPRGATEHWWLPAEPGAPAGRTTLASLRPALLLLNG